MLPAAMLIIIIAVVNKGMLSSLMGVNVKIKVTISNSNIDKAKANNMLFKRFFHGLTY